MKSYYLSEYELLKIAVFNGMGNHYGFIRKTVEEQLKYIDDTFLNYLTTKNSNMKSLVERFRNKYKYAFVEDKSNFKPIVIFKEHFKDEIDINNFAGPLFSSNYVYSTSSDRTILLKEIANKSPDFLFLIHNYIKQNKQSNISTPVFDAYFQILKQKSCVNLKKELSQDDIMSNIDCANVKTVLNIKKKISAYLNNFEKDLKLYNHITSQMKNHIQENGAVKIFWEDKLKLFPKEVVASYSRGDNKEISWGEEKEFYLYSFELNLEYVIFKTNNSKTHSQNLSNVFLSALSDFISKTFNGEKVMVGICDNKINIIFNEEQNKIYAKKFTQHVIDNLASIVEKYFIREKQMSDIKSELTEHFKKLNLSVDLDRKLSTKDNKTSISNINKKKI